MEQKKLPFRFRIPWTSGASASQTSSRRPKKEPKSPFRPPGIAPTHPPPSSSVTNESTPPSSSSASQQGKQKMTVSRQSEQKMKSPLKITPESEQHTPPLKRSTHHTGKLGKTHESQDPLKQEAPETKMMFSTSNPTGKDIKLVSSKDPMTSNVSNISTQKPVSPEKSPLPKGIIEDVTKGIIEDIANYVHKLSTGHRTKAMDENPFNVVTLAGENRGATMHVGSNPVKKERSIHIHRAYKKNPDQNPEATTDGEESSEEESSDSMKKNEAGNAYINSNIQSVNNSLMSQSSINDRDPGVHMVPQKPEKPVKCEDKRGLGPRNAEVNVSRQDQPSQGPRIRRRCLRGLLAEPSDSDPDNPNKPIRHGCKYSCGNI